MIPYFVKTGDGSPTVFDPAYEQSMHTMDGAYSEALVKHILPSHVLNMNRDILVLDIGFGLGYNVLALLCEAAGFDKRIEVVSLERDRSFESFVQQINFDDDRAAVYDSVKLAYINGSFESENIRLTVCFGDAREAVEKMTAKCVDAVFHDPFSPAKNPELWTVEFFHEIARCMKDDALLTTYSSAAQIRSAMIEAGLFVGKGPSMGMKREGTIAAKKDGNMLFTSGELEAMRNDKKAVPYRDPGLIDSRQSIIERRRVEMLERKRFLDQVRELV